MAGGKVYRVVIASILALWERGNIMKVTVATYEHRHGSDNRVFKSMGSAWSWRQSIAQDYWGDELRSTGKPSDPEEAADYYFEHMAGTESFSAEECEVED